MNDFQCRRNDDEDKMKKIMKSAIKEWMDERFAVFGKWTAVGIAIAAFGVLAHLIVQMNGIPWGK